MRSRRLAAALALVLAALPGCALTDLAGVTTPEPPASIPGSVAAVLPLPPTEDVVSATGRAGEGLRLAGLRSGLRLRYATLSPETAAAFLTDLGVSDTGFGPVQPLRIGEVTVLESVLGNGSATIHLEPRGEGGVIREFAAGVVARPPDGTLLPVIRGTIHLRSSGYLMLVGDLEDRVLFSALVRTRIEGQEVRSGTTPIDAHLLSVESFRVTDERLSRSLVQQGLPERGGEGGLVSYCLTQAQAAALRADLREIGTAKANPPVRVGTSRPCPLPAEGPGLTLRTEFSPLEFAYITRIEFGEGPGQAVTTTRHADVESVLVLVWGAGGPGENRAVLLELAPLE